MKIPDDAELIQGIKILSTVPLAKPTPAKPAEVVKASTAPPPAEPPLAEQVAQIRREMGAYAPLYENLSARLATLRAEEKGGMRGGVKMPPSGRARGAADAVDMVRTFLLPLVNGTAKKGHADSTKREITRLREDARTRAKAGNSAAMGAFDQYSDILKQL